MRWIINERPSRDVGLDESWWDWLKGLGLWDSVTGLGGQNLRCRVELWSCETLLSSSWVFGLIGESF